MRKLKDALRLKFEGGQSHQQIATVLGISKGGFYAQIHENFRMRFSSPFQQLLTILAQHAIRPKMPVKGLPRDSQLLA